MKLTPIILLAAILALTGCKPKSDDYSPDSTNMPSRYTVPSTNNAPTMDNMSRTNGMSPSVDNQTSTNRP